MSNYIVLDILKNLKNFLRKFIVKRWLYIPVGIRLYDWRFARNIVNKSKTTHNGYNTIVGFSINKIYNKLADYKFYNLLFFINP